MKKLILFFITLFVLSNYSNAQAPMDMNCNAPACGPVDVTLYAVQVGTCGPVIGISNPITMTPPAYHMNYCPTCYPPGFWNVDPAVTCPGCAWEWYKVDAISSTICGTPVGSPTTCLSGWDQTTVYAFSTCGTPVNTDCFEISNTCGTCAAGNVIMVDFGPGHCNVH